MVRYLPFLLELALLLYALVDCISTQDLRVRNLPKLAWIAIIVLIPIVGPLAWLFAGRPPREGRSGWPLRPGPAGRGPIAPDEDPEFLAYLKRRNERDRKKPDAAPGSPEEPHD